MATFDDAALFKLTAKIDNKLAESRRNTPSNGTRNELEPGNKKRKQAPDRGVITTEPLPKKRSRKEEKRERKPADKGHPPKPNKVIRDTKTKNTVGSDAQVLLSEIKALGGSEEDLRLVENVDSDEEVGDSIGNEKDPGDKLRVELARFAAGLGFEKVVSDFTAASSESEGLDGELQDEGSDDIGAGPSVIHDDSHRTTASLPPGPDKKSPESFKGNTIREPRPDWHAIPPKPLPVPSSDEMAPYMTAITALKTFATSVLNEDGTAYKTTTASSSSRKFMSTIMSSGTMSDRISALTLAIQESPIHNIQALESLLGFASKRSRGQALSSLAALVDLLGPGMILPSDRRLRSFSSQPGLLGTLQHHKVESWSAGQPLPGKITKEHLVSWVFEDWLKDAYFRMIQSLETWCDDEVEYARTKAIDLVFALLRDKPEQESNLLRLLVNKLGDRERKIASRASYLLLQLLNVHPRMKTVVVRTVEQDVIFRPGQNVRAKYYAVNTLNQTILSSKEPQVAEDLLRIYFNMFVTLLKSGELSRLGGPVAQDVKGGVKVNEPNKANRNRQLWKPLKRGDNGTKAESASDIEATEKLVSAILTGTNRALPFSREDQSTIESHLDTLFRITHSSNFNTSIQALMLIQQLSIGRQIATDRFYRTLYESLLDPRLATSSKQALYLNLLYRSLKSDVDVRRVKAFTKRMLQVLNLQQPSFVCGILYLISELSEVFADLRTLLTVPEEYDEDEIIHDAGSVDTPDGDTDLGCSRPASAYDGRKRDPEYSNAHRSCLWELLPFSKHFHPSVGVYASSLVVGQKATQKPELANHTLIAFLDKFVYRNAKATDSTKGMSIMQPVAATGQGHILVSNRPTVKDGASLNTSSFWNKKGEDVAEDEVFFHEYFAQIGRPRQVEPKRKSKGAETMSEDGGAEAGEDEEIWDALVSSHPELQGESDSDTGFDDLMNASDLEGDLMDETEESGDDENLDFLGESDLDSEDEDGQEDETGQNAEVKPAVDETGKSKTSASQQKARRRKALRNLPTFASADDYAEMLAGDDEL